MRGHEPQPLQARSLLDRPNEGGKAAATARVVVVVDVLAEQYDLPRSRIDRGSALLEHVGNRHVAFAASYAGHDAEGAVVVAALDDANVVADARAP